MRDPWRDHSWGYFKGSIDEIRVYSTSLSASEIQFIFNTERPHFQIIQGSYTWQEAKADAEARGGRLAVLNTQEKIDEVSALLQSQGTWTHLWLGAEKAAGSSNWVWIDGSSMAASHRTGIANHETDQEPDSNSTTEKMPALTITASFASLMSIILPSPVAILTTTLMCSPARAAEPVVTVRRAEGFKGPRVRQIDVETLHARLVTG